MTASTTPLRQDAARNRQRLLDAAAELFASRGLGVTLNDIAHHAGVGVGTAYRRFANKQELVEALFDERLQVYTQIAREALDDEDAWHGLVAFLQRSLRLHAEDRGLAELLMNDEYVNHEQTNTMRHEIAPLVNHIVDRAKRQGTLRADIEGTDVVFLQIGLNAIIDKTRQDYPDLYLRYLNLMLDGLRAERPNVTDLSVPPLTVDQTHELTTSS